MTLFGLEPLTIALLGGDPGPIVSPDRGASLRSAVGACIVEWRDRKAWSRRRLARELGVSDVCVGQWERGETLPNGENELALRRLGVALPTIPREGGDPTGYFWRGKWRPW